MDIKKVLSAVFLYISAIIGAGFAAGRELNVYFFKYGFLSGVAGMLTAAALFGLTAYKTLYIASSCNIKNCGNFFEYLFEKKLGRLFNIAGILFFTVLLASMTAAFGEICHSFGLNKILARAFFCIACFAALCFDLKGIKAISGLLCPLMAAGCCFIGLQSIYSVDLSFSLPDMRVFPRAVIYVSYNILTGAAVLFFGKKFNKKEACAAGIIIFAAIFVTGTLAGAATLGCDAALPIYLAVKEDKALLILYICVLLAAVFTTALSSAFCLTPYIKKRSICILGFMLSLIGFSTIVENFYFIFGILGSGVLFAVLMLPLKMQ